MMRLLSKRETAKIIGFHPEHLMRLARAGEFPQPIKLGAAANCAVRFVAEEVDAWIVARSAARATKPAAGQPARGSCA
jgi:predicted DNA-binding transcriptional regulator AlpA